MDKRDNLSFLPYILIFAAGAAAFILLIIFSPGFQFSFFVKVIPALSLTAAALFAPSGLKPKEKAAVVFAAALCGAGDVLLDIDRVRLFVPGLGAFLLGHIGFLLFFIFRFDKGSRRKWWALPVAALAVVMGIVLAPKLGTMLVPVFAYLIVITGMTVFAVFSRTHFTAALGAFIFMVSDALLALAKFVFDGRPSPAVSIPVYYAGLFLLGFGILFWSKKEG